MNTSKDRWSALSMQQRADLIKLYTSNGITNIKDIRRHYNSFDDGGYVEDLNSKMLFNPIKQENTLVNKTYPKNYVEKTRNVNIEKDLVAGLNDISEKLSEGWYAYYDNNTTNNSKNRFIKDKQTGIIYEDFYNDTDPINLEYFDVIPYTEIRKSLPKRDYIGGDVNTTRMEAFNRIPGLKDKIKELSITYGIDANVLAHRFFKEGYLDQAILEYNMLPATYQKEYFKELPNKEVDGFNSLGLDDAGSNLLENKYNLRRDIDWWDINTTNEKNRDVKSVSVNNLWDGLEIKAADMEYRQNILKERGINNADLPTYVNAAYNLGLYHEDLKNHPEWIKNNYTVPNYYSNGGKFLTKRRK